MPALKLVTVLLVILLPSCLPQRGVYHTVQEGQTLYRISRTYGVDERYLARINNIDDPTRLQPGDLLFIPGADRERKVPATVPSLPGPPAKSSAPSRSTASAGGPAAQLSAGKKADSPAAPKVPPTQNIEMPPATKGKFIWPAKGKILSQFGQEGSAYRKGLEIALPLGHPVVSAAAGRVIYSGNGIRGYGNLIILKHDDSFYTVYGFNQKNLVGAGVFVSKGEMIAQVGTPPGGGSPRLYFEIRFGKAAVDPIFYLP